MDCVFLVPVKRRW